MTNIKWNPQLKLIVSDVDETVADLYVKAEPEMIKEITTLLEEGKVIFFVTGQGLRSVQWRIIDQIPQHLRKKILVGHCSGSEVWGHDEQGNLLSRPYYSVYEQTLSELQKKEWRELIDKLISEFNLETYPTMPVSEFIEQSQGNPLAVMLEDRGPQITFEVVNGYQLTAEQTNDLNLDIPETDGTYDLRTPILKRANELLKEAGLPINARLAGVFAVDFAVGGASKTTAVVHVLNDESVLSFLDLSKEDVAKPEYMEVWGDKFSEVKGGTDRHMSEALPKKVRSIDFRHEDPQEFMKGYNTVLWDGEKHLHEGLLEYLQMREK